MTKNRSIRRLSAVVVTVSIVLSCCLLSNTAVATKEGVTEADKRRLLADYEAAKASGDELAAVGHVLDYAEADFGENAPQTIKLMHRYGQLLYESGRYRDATSVLKDALERSEATHGEYGGDAFEINMNIGYALSRWSTSLSARTRYFDRALEIMRESGQRETIGYLATLVNITVNLMEDGGLKGDYSTNVGDYFEDLENEDYFATMEQEYRNYFHVAEKYVLEAVELAGLLEGEDEYIASKIAIAQAKLNVMETADLASVPMGVQGYISGGTERDRYEREELRLNAAIEDLSRDAAMNRVFLTAANKVRMEIAWLSEDEARMAAMCTEGALNSATDYSTDRLFEVTEGGLVLAPGLGLKISRNLFRPVRVETDRRGKPIKKPHFIPVCIDGRLMAALSHVPRVTVEEIRRGR